MRAPLRAGAAQQWRGAGAPAPPLHPDGSPPRPPLPALGRHASALTAAAMDGGGGGGGGLEGGGAVGGGASLEDFFGQACCFCGSDVSEDDGNEGNAIVAVCSGCDMSAVHAECLFNKAKVGARDRSH